MRKNRRLLNRMLRHNRDGAIVRRVFMEQSSLVENSNQDLGTLGTSDVQSPSEKMVTISESKFNDTIRHSNARVAEKARQEERRKWESQQSDSNPAAQQNNYSQMSPDEIKRIATEAAAAQHQEIMSQDMKRQMDAEGARIAQDFFSKLNNADKNLYPNLEENIKSADFATMPEIVSIANTIDGTDGIINEILSNPTKIPVLRALAITQPALAKIEFQKMADSIKLNQQAANAKMPREPLSQISPSSAVGLDSGPMSVKDFRQLFKSK